MKTFQDLYTYNNNLLHLYSAFLGTQSASHRRGGISSTTTSVQHPPGWCDGSHIVPERPPHTPAYWWRGDSVMKPISVWGWLGGHDGQRPTGKFGQDAGVTPLLFFSKDILGFLMTTESQDLGLTSLPKDGAFYSIVSLSLHWGVRTHTDHRMSTPCRSHLHLFQQQPSFPRRSPIQVLTSSTLLNFSEQPVLGCRVIWLLARIVNFNGLQTVEGQNDSFSAASKGYKQYQTMNKGLI